MTEGKVKINNNEYDISGLSDEAKALVNSIRFTEAELRRAEALVAVLKTAHSRYSDDLAKTVEGTKEALFTS